MTKSSAERYIYRSNGPRVQAERLLCPETRTVCPRDDVIVIQMYEHSDGIARYAFFFRILEISSDQILWYTIRPPATLDEYVIQSVKRDSKKN